MTGLNSSISSTITSFSSSLENFIPILLIFLLSLYAIIVCWEIIKRWGFGVFGLDSNSKYKKRRSLFVKNHSVDSVDPGYYDDNGVRYYTNYDVYERDLRDYETKIYQDGYKYLSEHDSNFRSMSSEDQMMTLGKYKAKYMDSWYAFHDLDLSKNKR